MANWTVATTYKRFKQIVENHMGLAYEDIDKDNMTLEEIDDLFRNQIVEEATK